MRLSAPFWTTIGLLLAAWTIRKALSCLFAAISFCGLQPFSQGKFTPPFSQAFEANAGKHIRASCLRSLVDICHLSTLAGLLPKYCSHGVACLISIVSQRFHVPLFQMPRPTGLFQPYLSPCIECRRKILAGSGCKLIAFMARRWT